MTADPDGSSMVQDRRGVAEEPSQARWMTLPAAAHATGLARRATREALVSWTLGHLEETAALLVSELVGNAVRHAVAGAVALGLRLGASAGRRRVEDPHRDRPAP